MSRVHGSSRSAFYRAPSHVLPAPKRGWRSLLGSRWATTAAASACVLALLLLLSGSRRSDRSTVVLQPDLLELRRSERLQYGRVQRRYVKGARALILCVGTTMSHSRLQLRSAVCRVGSCQHIHAAQMVLARASILLCCWAHCYEGDLASYCCNSPGSHCGHHMMQW